MSEKNFIFVGSSHVNAIIGAISKNERYKRVSDIIHLPTHAEGRPVTYRDSKRKLILNDNISFMLNGFIEKKENPVLVLLIGGNGHNSVGLIRPPEPFDFLLPGKEEIIDPGHFIPYQQMYDYMRQRINLYLIYTELFKSVVDIPVYQLEPPPPIGSEEHILKYLDKWFDLVKHDTWKVTPKELRHKCWRLHTQVNIDFSKKIGVDFIPAPKDSMDDHGFLREECYPLNATHGNTRYGEMVLDDLIMRFNTKA